MKKKSWDLQSHKSYGAFGAIATSDLPDQLSVTIMCEKLNLLGLSSLV